MNFGTTPISASELVERVVRRIQAKAGLPKEAVFETLASDEDHCEFPPSDRFVTVTPQRFTPGLTIWAGAARNSAAYDADFRVACLSRFASDQELRNTRELRDRVASALALALAVNDALNTWDAASDADATKSLLREPVAPPAFDVTPKRVRKGSPWGVVAMNFTAKFVLALPSGATPP